MAYGNVPNESPGNIAQSARYNQLVANVDDLDTRLDVTEALTTNTSGTVGTGNQRLSDRLGAGVTNANTASSQLSALQTLTTDTATNGGQGNARLADRFGTGVGTGANVTTGSATSQLTDLRSRATALEGVTQHATSGNSALSTRVTTAQAKADLAYSGLSIVTKYPLGSNASVNAAGLVTIMSQSISVTSATNSILVIGNVDVAISGTLTGVNPGTGTGALAIELTVDGVAQTPQIIFATTVATRSSISQSWALNNLSSGSHTLLLRMSISGVPSPYPTYTAWASHTGLTVTISNK